MIRTQIQLTEDQVRKLKALSLASNESMAALIRKAVERLLVTGHPHLAARYRQALSVAGKYEAAQSDTAVEHHRYLEKAFKA